MRPLAEPTRARIRAALGALPGGGALASFAEAVVALRAHPLGTPLAEDATSNEERVASRVVRLLRTAADGYGARASVAAELAEDRALLAAFFQNLDLLPVERDAHVDGVLLAVGAAVGRLGESSEA